VKHLFSVQQETEESQSSDNILGTIILPKDLKLLAGRLPKANYDSPLKIKAMPYFSIN